jgi:hypothetical protein
MNEQSKVATVFFDQRPMAGAQCPTAYFREANEAKTWRSRFQVILQNPRLRSHFHTTWTECGHRIREQLDDDQVLAAALRMMLPRYEGSMLEVYRGENIDRWEAGRVGFCWTTNVEVARGFGRGLNAVKLGGVLLRCVVGREAVITGPSAHSIYLGEHEVTVDPSRLDDVEAIERYSPSSFLQ